MDPDNIKICYHRPACKTPHKWRFAGMPMIAQHCIPAWYFCDFTGDPEQYRTEPYIFVIFRGGVRPLSPGSIRAWINKNKNSIKLKLLRKLIMIDTTLANQFTSITYYVQCISMPCLWPDINKDTVMFCSDNPKEHHHKLKPPLTMGATTNNELATTKSPP